MDGSVKAKILDQVWAAPWNGVKLVVNENVWSGDYWYSTTTKATIEEIEVFTDIDRWHHRCAKHDDIMRIGQYIDPKATVPVVTCERKLWALGVGPYARRFGVYLGQCEECHTIYYGIRAE